MKTKRTLFLMTLAVLLLAATIGGSYVGADTASYQIMARNANWDAQIDKALAHRYVENSAYGIYSFDSVTVTPEAYQMIYELGPEVVPHILDRVQRSEKDSREESFLVSVASFILQSEVQYKAADNPHLNGTPQYYAYNLRAFLETVPEQVESICGGSGTQEEKLEQLSELGLAALPYITARIEQGETQWTPYLETQLLGMTEEERFEALKTQVDGLYAGSIDSIYAHRQQIAKPVDAAQWIAANRDTLSVLKDVTG